MPQCSKHTHYLMIGNIDSYLRMIDEIEDYAFFLLSKEGIVEHCNRGAEIITGYKKDILLNKNFNKFFSVDAISTGIPEKLLAEATSEGKAIYNGLCVGNNDKQIWKNIVITAIHDNRNKVIGFSQVERDITNEVLLKDKLDQENEELKLKFRLKEEEVNLSEKRFLALIDQNYDFISMKDEYGNILYLSPSTIRIIGYTFEEMQGQNAVDFFHEDDISDVIGRMNSAMNNPGVPIWGRNRIRHKDGHFIWVEGTTTNLINDKNVAALVGNFRDVTEYKEAEQVIKESKAQLENLLRGMGDAFLSFNSKWVATFANENALNLFKTTSDDVVGKLLWDILPELSNTTFEAEFRRVMETRGSATFEAYYQKYNMWIEVKLYPHLDGIAVFLNDITERKEIEERIVSREYKFRALIENSSDAISMFNSQGAITYQSKSAERISGFSIEEIHGQQAASMVHPDDSEKVLWVFKKALLNPGVPQFNPHRIKHKTKGWIYAEGTLNNLLHDEHVQAVVSNFRDITERKEAELKIIHANRLYAFISNINQTIVHVSDEQTVFKEACRIAIDFGKFKMSWIGLIDTVSRKVNIIEHAGLALEDVPFFRNVDYKINGPIEQVLNTGSYYICNDIQGDVHLEHWKPYATMRGLSSTMVLPIKKSGTIIGIFNLYSAENNFFSQEEINLLQEAAGDISFALDVFEKDKQRREAEENLEKNEFRLNEAQQIAHLGNWEIDFVSGKDIWSDEACRILGYEPGKEMPSFEAFMSYIHPEDMEYVKKVMKASESELKNASFNHRIIRRDGVIRHIYSESKFEYDKTGKTERLHGIIHDITESKEAEASLEQSEANLRLIMNLIPQSIFARNIKGEYLFANNCFAAYYGLTPQQIINKSVFEIAPVKAESEILLQQDHEVINSGKTIVFPEIPFTDSEGNKHIFHSVKVPYTPAGKSEKAVLGIAIDITDRKHTEAERTKMINEIVQRNKDLEQFSYIISHNLRSPVANILGITNLLQDVVYNNAEDSELVAELAGSASKLDSVIKDINAVLQVKHEIGEIREWVKFSDLVSDITLNLQKQINKEEVKIVTDFAAIDETFVLKSYIYSIFYNLISNSIKYRKADVKPVIEISSYKTTTHYGLIFKDNGLGIDLKRKGDQVFGLYKRFHLHIEGKGMGLYMVKIQVETLGGTISLDSEVDKGTEFKIEFELES